MIKSLEDMSYLRPPKKMRFPAKLIPLWFIELFGYGLVSLVALAADLLILRGLVRVAGWRYLPASALSFTAGAGIAYLLSVYFIFGSHRGTNRALEFGYFLAIGVVGLAVNSLAMWISVGLVGFGLIPGKLMAAVCSFATNFALRRLLLFSFNELTNP